MRNFLKNPSKNTLYMREWRGKKGKEYKKKQAEYWKKNKYKYNEICLERANKYYSEHREHVIKNVKKYHKEHYIHLGQPLNENHHQWKGEKASYGAKHSWIYRNRGKPNICEVCGDKTKKFYDWANIDHKYKRNLNDYIRMCRSCHRKHDYKNNLANIPTRWGTIQNKF